MWPFNSAKLHVSLDGTLGYVADDNFHPRYWLSLEKIPGEVPADKRGPGNIFTPIWVNFTLNDGTIYHRKALPFAFFEVKSDGKGGKKIKKNSDFYLDYIAMSQGSL